MLTGERPWKPSTLDKRAGGGADLHPILHDVGKFPLEHVHVLEHVLEHFLEMFEYVAEHKWIHDGLC